MWGDGAVVEAAARTVGGERLACDGRRSCGPMLEWRRVGRAACEPPGVPPGEEAHEGAILILGAMSVLSDSRRPGSSATTRKKFPPVDGPALVLAPAFMLFEFVELFEPKNHWLNPVFWTVKKAAFLVVYLVLDELAPYLPSGNER